VRQGYKEFVAMTLIGKILTVLIFIMSIVFMALAMTTFATHRNWRDVADSTNPSNPGLKQRIEKLDGDIKAKLRELDRAKLELAEEQAARRAELATLQGKLAFAQVQLQKDREEYDNKLKDYNLKQERAKDLATSLKSATDRIALIEESLRKEQVEREQQFLLAVKYNELLNQALSALENIKERKADLEERYALLESKAAAAGIDITTFVADRAPAIDARVLKVNAAGNLVEISIGSDDGIKKGHTMNVFRGNTFLGTITIRELEFDRAVGEVDKKLQRGQIRAGDNVTTRIS
jgi:chromosome segregation ATPase